jgi:hypothetical protein
VASVASVALAAAFAAYTWPPDSPVLQGPTGGAGMIYNDTVAGTPYSFDDIALCIDRPGSVSVEAIEIANPRGGLKVREFSMRDSRTGHIFNYISEPQTTLTDAGFSVEAPFLVTIECPDDKEHDPNKPAMSLLGIEVERPDNDQAAYGTGVVVHYRTDGDAKELFVPFGIVLCPGSSPDQRPDCDITEVRPPD